ncbi:MAG: hypothetical protein NC218_12030, partial [Acetobacter sp.]|nr:hypothetical protein [Acetobacter sp.]
MKNNLLATTALAVIVFTTSAMAKQISVSTGEEIVISNKVEINNSDTSAIVNKGTLLLENGADFYSNKNDKDKQNGGAILNSGTIIIKNGVNFDSNEVTGHGGAIFNNGKITIDGKATFKNNKTIQGSELKDPYYRGGAILNRTDSTFSEIIFNGETEFSDNTSANSGGAIDNISGKITFNKKAIFMNNQAKGYGGAIYNYGNDKYDSEIIFNDGVEFSNSKMPDEGYSSSFIHNATETSKVFIKGDALFQNAYINAGSAVLNQGLFQYEDENGVISFLDNTAPYASALSNGGNGEVIIKAKKVIFDNNDTMSLDKAYAGAIWNTNKMEILGEENIFTNNKSQSTGNNQTEDKIVQIGGGAIQYRASGTGSYLIIGTENSVNNFANNEAVQNGGAILARGEGDDNATTTISGTTTFSGNKAGGSGGAIYNKSIIGDNGVAGKSYITIAGNSTFSNNYAGKEGGAVYNSENTSLNLSGEATFSENKAGEKYNDIHNLG